MAKKSAGVLIYRMNEGILEVFLVHPGGPFWGKKDAGAWSIPKGEFAHDEEPLAAACREFKEEVGVSVQGDFFPLGSVRQSGGKTVYAWAIEHNLDSSRIRSTTFSMEWPPRSGKHREFPEVDRAAWFPAEMAREKMVKGQWKLVERLREKINRTSLNSDG